jgi:hypothetical protein
MSTSKRRSPLYDQLWQNAVELHQAWLKAAIPSTACLKKVKETSPGVSTDRTLSPLSLEYWAMYIRTTLFLRPNNVYRVMHRTLLIPLEKSIKKIEKKKLTHFA